MVIEELRHPPLPEGYVRHSCTYESRKSKQLIVVKKVLPPLDYSRMPQGGRVRPREASGRSRRRPHEAISRERYTMNLTAESHQERCPCDGKRFSCRLVRHPSRLVRPKRGRERFPCDRVRSTCDEVRPMCDEVRPMHDPSWGADDPWARRDVAVLTRPWRSGGRTPAALRMVQARPHRRGGGPAGAEAQAAEEAGVMCHADRPRPRPHPLPRDRRPAARRGAGRGRGPHAGGAAGSWSRSRWRWSGGRRWAMRMRRSSIMGSAALMRAAVETGRIGRPADKREFLPRFRPTIAGTAQERSYENREHPEVGASCHVPQPSRE